MVQLVDFGINNFMKNLFYLFFKYSKRVFDICYRRYWNWYANTLLEYHNVKHGKCTFNGKTYFTIFPKAICKIGDDFIVNSGPLYCINCSYSIIIISNGAELTIGNNSGMSATTLAVREKVNIGNNVNIGAETMIFDNNFHSIDPQLRMNRDDDIANVKTAPIIIEDNVFIGTRCIITKGVIIGENSIVAAGSVVVKSIPKNEVWGGNPAKFIKNI